MGRVSYMTDSEHAVDQYDSILTVLAKLPKGNNDWLMSCRFKQYQFSNTALYYICTVYHDTHKQLM